LAALSDTFDEHDQIAERVDLPLMRERYWKDTEEDPDRERRRQAEFLVHHRVPWEVIEEIGVMDATIKTRVEAILSSTSGVSQVPRVSVRSDWYYQER
jgi:ssDNA thymidine ADP-ribosyltransferase, DarT